MYNNTNNQDIAQKIESLVLGIQTCQEIIKTAPSKVDQKKTNTKPDWEEEDENINGVTEEVEFKANRWEEQEETDKEEGWEAADEEEQEETDEEKREKANQKADEIARIHREFENAKAKLPQYLDDLLDDLQKINSLRLSRSRLYQEFVKYEKDPDCPAKLKQLTKNAVRRFLLKEIDNYTVWYNYQVYGHKDEQEDAPEVGQLTFLLYFDTLYKEIDQKKEKAPVRYDSKMLANMENKNNIADDESSGPSSPHSVPYIDPFDDVDEKKAARTKKQKERVLECMSQEMFEALKLYFDEFNELNPLNIATNLEKELSEKKGKSKLFDQLKDLSGSDKLSGVADFLKWTMESCAEI